MVFKLTEQELDNAFSAINHHGYNALIPEPMEWLKVKKNWDAIRTYIKELDLDSYEPFTPMIIFAPKNRANIRVVHLLHPQDMIIYTSLVLIIKDVIEASRISRRKSRVFSYRADLSRSDRLYNSSGAYDSYLEQLDKKTKKSGVKFIGITDIGDFFPRIYQHRLNNIINTLATNQRERDVSRVLVDKLISKLMNRNSYGIPVGPYASRLLAEAVLIDIDAALHSEKIDFVRWVDDYHIFCKSEYEAQSIIFKLGASLYSLHGLTLQSAKTKILPIKKYLREVLHNPEDGVTKRDQVVALLKSFKGHYEDEEDEVLDDEEIQQALEELQSIDLEGMLNNSISDKTLVDYEIVKYVLTKLPRVPGIQDRLNNEVLSLIIDNAEHLYPVSEQIAKYIISLENLNGAEKKRLAKKLLKPIKSKFTPPPDYYVMWVLHIFSTSKDWNHIDDIMELYKNSTSEIVKRYAALAIANGGTRSQAVVIKDNFQAASNLLKLAILEVSTKLGVDERKHWKLANQVSGAIEKII